MNVNSKVVGTVSMHEEQNARKQVLELLSSWGKNTIFRYLRDHHLLESFVEVLPLKNYEDTDEFAIQKALIGVWDDFSFEKLQEMKAWQRSNFDASVGRKAIAFALDLDRRGQHEACLEVLRIAADLDRVESMQTTSKKVRDLAYEDIIVATSAGVGFGEQKLFGTVEDTTVADGGQYIVRVATANGEKYSSILDADEVVTVRVMVKNRMARSLKTQCLDRLVRAQLLSTGSAQARLGRLRYALEQEIEDME
jgi:hypothetical protein